MSFPFRRALIPLPFSFALLLTEDLTEPMVSIQAFSRDEG